MVDLGEPLAYAFMQRALVGSILVGVVCASIGVFVVLRGLAFLGDAIAHAAFPGVVLASLAKVNVALGGTVAALLGALAIGLIARRSRLREDTVIGIVFSGMFALGVVLFSGIRSYSGDLLGLLFGDVLAISGDQLVLAAVLCAAILGTLWLLWKELVFVSFDPVGAAAAGLRVVLYDTILIALVGLAIAVSIQLIGIVLVVALLVTPAASARLVATRMRGMLVAAVGFALASCVLGIYASYYLDKASGGTIVLVATLLFALTWAARTVRERVVRA